MGFKNKYSNGVLKKRVIYRPALVSFDTISTGINTDYLAISIWISVCYKTIVK